jgi:hypothetical protein
MLTFLPPKTNPSQHRPALQGLARTVLATT